MAAAASVLAPFDGQAGCSAALKTVLMSTASRDSCFLPRIFLLTACYANQVALAAWRYLSEGFCGLWKFVVYLPPPSCFGLCRYNDRGQPHSPSPSSPWSSRSARWMPALFGCSSATCLPHSRASPSIRPRWNLQPPARLWWPQAQPLSPFASTFHLAHTGGSVEYFWSELLDAATNLLSV